MTAPGLLRSCIAQTVGGSLALYLTSPFIVSLALCPPHRRETKVRDAHSEATSVLPCPLEQNITGL